MNIRACQKSAEKSYMQSSPHWRVQPRIPSPSPSGTSALDSGSAHSRYQGGGSLACQSRQGECIALPLRHLPGMTKIGSLNLLFLDKKYSTNLALQSYNTGLTMDSAKTKVSKMMQQKHCSLQLSYSLYTGSLRQININGTAVKFVQKICYAFCMNTTSRNLFNVSLLLNVERKH